MHITCSDKKWVEATLDVISTNVTMNIITEINVTKIIFSLIIRLKTCLYEKKLKTYQ